MTWDVGRTGKLTPLAHLEPVELAGATIRGATLNTYEDILKHAVIGANVFIRRSNDVIRKYWGISYRSELTPIGKSTHCPACGTELEEVGPNLFLPQFAEL